MNDPERTAEVIWQELQERLQQGKAEQAERHAKIAELKAKRAALLAELEQLRKERQDD